MKIRYGINHPSPSLARPLALQFFPFPHPSFFSKARLGHGKDVTHWSPKEQQQSSSCWLILEYLKSDNVIISMLVWREEKARKRLRIWAWSNFLGQFSYPRAIIIGQKRTNSPPLQIRLEVKCVSLKEATHQLLRKLHLFISTVVVKMLQRNVTSQTTQKNSW